MSTKPDHSEQSQMFSSATAKQEGASMATAALARRRMLLASLGKGGALATAASIPLQSLAAIGTLSVTDNGKRCTVSGVGSAIHSRETVTTKCTGRSPSVYQNNIANWPNYDSSTRTATNSTYTVKVKSDGTIVKDTAFSAIFGSGSGSGIFALLKASSASDEAVWITALLNSLSSGASSSNFPYTSTQVIGLYKDKTPEQRTAAVSFFRGYMQTVM